ncbi:PIG-L family deacetylase [Galbitalea soli]|uniref:Mycothiol biosynthesis protein n=1 Tax=Galbitalea soli TaxID=1268042 RepID=A0A7C9PLZ4_9MICO|nr:PIG-L family deacetylase [Galbitalea soli]NEM90614.1 mycothiol biosynthesis protein [Galbitalea soli]NYJ31332.1 N-acetyl-1-D-myo-inositol-2-amino-2-deoxy-alpha-D-glucopyranoside deacetylase [Galbitalea soli]
MAEQERVLFVHAHPDDETIATGGVIATLVDQGAAVTVLTCTRGERGEVIPHELQYLLRDQDALAEHRASELAAALAVLGVTDHRFLGDAHARWAKQSPRRYRDSGMQWGSAGAEATDDAGPDSLTAADFGEVAADIAAVILDTHPTAVVSYNEWGGYGHPDHIRAQQAARRAAEVYGIPFFAIEPRGSGATGLMEVDVAEVLDRKRAALSAHRTQLVVTDDSFALSNGEWQPIDVVERFRRVHHEPDGPVPFRERSLATRIAGTVATLILGVCAGVILTINHQSSSLIGTVAVPLGLLFSIALVIALLAGLRIAFDTRVYPGAAAVGLIGTVALLSSTSGGGTVLIPNNAVGVVWAIAPTAVAFVVLAWPRITPRSAGRMKAPVVKGSPLQ